MTSSRSPSSSSRFYNSWSKGVYHIRSISALKRAVRGDEFVVKVAGEGLEKAERTWESVSRVVYDAPVVLRKELKALRLRVEQKRELVQRNRSRL